MARSWNLYISPSRTLQDPFSVPAALDMGLAAIAGELVSRYCVQQLKPFQGGMVGGLVRLVNKVVSDIIFDKAEKAVKDQISISNESINFLRRGAEITIATYLVTHGLAAAGHAVAFRWVLLLSVIENLRTNAIQIV